MITALQVTVGTSPVLLAALPPGPYRAAVTNGGASAMYLGTGSAVTASSGVPVPSSGVVPLEGFASSPPAELWAVTATLTATAGVLICDGS